MFEDETHSQSFLDSDVRVPENSLSLFPKFVGPEESFKYDQSLIKHTHHADFDKYEMTDDEGLDGEDLDIQDNHLEHSGNDPIFGRPVPESLVLGRFV